MNDTWAIYLYDFSLKH